MKTAKPTRVISMSDRPPIVITTADWKPKFVEEVKHGKKRHLTFRTHKDGKRAIVHAVQKPDGSQYVEHYAGYECKVREIAAVIMDVAEEMEDKTDSDWILLADQLIRQLDPVEIT